LGGRTDNEQPWNTLKKTYPNVTVCRVRVEFVKTQ